MLSTLEKKEKNRSPIVIDRVQNQPYSLSKQMAACRDLGILTLASAVTAARNQRNRFTDFPCARNGSEVSLVTLGYIIHDPPTTELVFPLSTSEGKFKDILKQMEESQARPRSEPFSAQLSKTGETLPLGTSAPVKLRGKERSCACCSLALQALCDR